jgi:hypothetical protein
MPNAASTIDSATSSLADAFAFKSVPSNPSVEPQPLHQK